MQTLVKQAREVGTSAGVLLPRSWLNKQVVVTLFPISKEEIAKRVFDILVKKKLYGEIKGIYLFGSYARGDYNPESDIDVLVITQKTNKLISDGNYEIILISEKNFAKNLPFSLYYLSILKEAEIILNRELIEKYSSKEYLLKIKKVCMEIERIFKINKETIKLCIENNIEIPDGVIYSIVLRLREIYLIKNLALNKKYNNKDFLKIVGELAYAVYSQVKRDKKASINVPLSEIINLLNLTEKWLKELKGLKKELKV